MVYIFFIDFPVAGKKINNEKRKKRRSKVQELIRLLPILTWALYHNIGNVL